jgi:hypothetical protein
MTTRRTNTTILVPFHQHQPSIVLYYYYYRMVTETKVVFDCGRGEDFNSRPTKCGGVHADTTQFTTWTTKLLAFLGGQAPSPPFQLLLAYYYFS